MAEAILNPSIPALDKTTVLYDLYTRFYDGMTKAGQVGPPDYVSNPPFEMNEDGTPKLDDEGLQIVDQALIKQGLADYTDILSKNSAYMMANAIVSTISPGDGGGGVSGYGLVSRSGDSMQGTLTALYGFQAGSSNKVIFDTYINNKEQNIAAITGHLTVSDDATIDGTLHLSNDGMTVGGNKAIYFADSKLNISSNQIQMTGDVLVDGTIKLGDVTVNENGVWYGDFEFYHSGNSNKQDVDWSMANGHVWESMTIEENLEMGGNLYVWNGFTLCHDNTVLLYSRDRDNMILSSDLNIANNHGLKVADNYIVWVRNEDVISFAAPGSILNLGDKGVDAGGNELPTDYIALQANIKNASGAYDMVTADGSGNFPNGFSAGVSNGEGSTFQTYVKSKTDRGVVAKDYIRLGATDGPGLTGIGGAALVTVPFQYPANDGFATEWRNARIYADYAASIVLNPLHDQTKSATYFDTSSEYFGFDKPIESESFVVKSDLYKTRLEEDALFFDDGKFIEGVETGIRLSQNSLFDGNLYSFNPNSSSVSFSSGFAGSGWAIMEDQTAGGIHATFDSLTIRKKMRVYELEVQKISVTNGSLWVSDSCSGDEVREL